MDINRESAVRLGVLVVVVVGVGVGTVVMFGLGSSQPTLTVEDAQVGVGETTTTTLTLTAIPDGISGYDAVVIAGNDNVAIPNASVNDALRFRKSNVTTDGRVALRGVDLRQRMQSGEGPVTLATITVRGERSGTTTLEISVGSMDDDQGYRIEPTVDDGTVTVGS